MHATGFHFCLLVSSSHSTMLDTNAIGLLRCSLDERARLDIVIATKGLCYTAPSHELEWSDSSLCKPERNSSDRLDDVHWLGKDATRRTNARCSSILATDAETNTIGQFDSFIDAVWNLSNWNVLCPSGGRREKLTLFEQKHTYSRFAFSWLSFARRKIDKCASFVIWISFKTHIRKPLKPKIVTHRQRR